KSSLYLNDGTGRFTWSQGTFSLEKHDTEEVELADFDRDGHLDAVFIAEDDGGHEFYLGGGDGTFRDVSTRLPSRSVVNDVEVGDLNADGALDLFVSSTGYSHSEDSETQPGWRALRQ